MIKNKKSKKIAILVAAIVAVILVVSLWWFFIRSDSSDNTPKPDIGEEAINYNPPTKTEENEAETRKDEIIKEQSQPNSTNETKPTNSVTITAAALNGKNVEVRGYVSGVVQEGGTCTYVFTGNGSVTKTSSGMADVSTTSCGISVPRTSLPGTGWKVVINYKLGATTASSSAQSIDGL